MRAALLEPDDPRWVDVLGSVRHDCYHLPDYVRLSAEHEGGEPAAVLVEDGPRALLQPVIVRPISGGGHDATTPYGYPGPLVRGDAAWLSAGLAAAVEHLAERGLVSLFVRLHPLLNPEPPVGVGAVRREGPTVSLDLAAPEAEQWRQVRGNHRIHINRARRAGRVARFDDAWTHEATFVRLYHATMARVDAGGWYFFDQAHVAALRTALGERLRLVVVEADGEIAAAGLFVATNGIIQYHLSGSDERWAREGLTKIMIDHVRRWGSERGDEVLHLGGGVGGAEDALYHFKTGFSERRHEFRTLRAVLDPAAYARLAGGTTSASDAGFFPAYRAGGRSAAAIPADEAS